MTEGRVFPGLGLLVGNEQHQKVKKRHFYHFSEILPIGESLKYQTVIWIILRGIQIASTYYRAVEIHPIKLN